MSLKCQWLSTFRDLICARTLSPSIVKLAAVGGGCGVGFRFSQIRVGNLLPPRTPERDATNPPQTFLQQHGLTPAETHRNLHLSGHQIPWVSLLVHFWLFINFRGACCGSQGIMFRCSNWDMAVCGGLGI